MHRKLSLNEHVFDTLTPLSTYWVGFLMADGSITDAGCIRLQLAEKDAAHVSHFRSFLESNHKINISKKRAHLLVVSSRHMAAVLATYGVVPRKTATATVCNALAMDPDFWRGVIDGDGCIRATKHGPAIELVGSHKLVKQFVTFVSSVVKNRVNVLEYPNYARVRYHGTRYQILLDVLRPNNAFCLDRKWK